MNKKEYLDLSVHEVKNILSAIGGYSEFISGGLVEGEKALKLAAKIKELSDMMAVFADKKYMYDLLKDHLYQPEFDMVQICEQLENVSHDVAVHVTDPADFRINCDRNMEIYGDRLLIKELFYALMENASKYALDRETTEISVQSVEDEIVISLKNKSDEITEEEITRLTEPYFRVNKEMSRKMGGQGFGLAIAAEIMEIHGGNMKIAYENGYLTVALHFRNCDGGKKE